MKQIFFIFIICLIIFSIFSCKEKKKGRIMAEVGNEKLYEKELRSLFTKSEWNNLSQENKEKAIQDWVEITSCQKKQKNEVLIRILL